MRLMHSLHRERQAYHYRKVHTTKSGGSTNLLLPSQQLFQIYRSRRNQNMLNITRMLSDKDYSLWKGTPLFCRLLQQIQGGACERHQHVAFCLAHPPLACSSFINQMPTPGAINSHSPPKAYTINQSDQKHCIHAQLWHIIRQKTFFGALNPVKQTIS